MNLNSHGIKPLMTDVMFTGIWTDNSFLFSVGVACKRPLESRWKNKPVGKLRPLRFHNDRLAYHSN